MRVVIHCEGGQAIGVGHVLICVVENQRIGYDRVIGAGAALGLGGPDFEDPAIAVAGARLAKLIDDRARRQQFAVVAAGVVDGLGAWRIVHTWEYATQASPFRPVRPLSTRSATIGDASELWQWRNDALTRASSKSSDMVPWPAYRAWLGGTLDRADRHLLILSDDAGDVGTVRWDQESGGECEASITVAPERRGQALAASMLHTAERHLASTTEVSAFRAVVHADNVASRRLFVGAGYVAEEPADEHGFEQLRKQPTQSGSTDRVRR